ncbi:NAD(P)-binding protein [Nannocystis pusilla]|uniref:NAD(P)-binding protein n=1 Tax=Nannocystis pusilla TaxID=889268 RepID=A0A9X3EVS6_9BACT|nr:NAD(P)-binding protein [Nannocystis pusilla]MCY1011222.1 NAD(P)-binding protein [Nannocystis pusilla]
MAGDPDAIVIGSGPNGLVAACMLARAGLRVLVCEAHSRRWGGALGSEEATLPGFVHDVGAAFFPFPRISPAFRALELEKHVELCFAEFESCHPRPTARSRVSAATSTSAPATSATRATARPSPRWPAGTAASSRRCWGSSSTRCRRSHLS